MKKPILRTFFLLSTILVFFNFTAKAANGIILYTPYTKISVPPGESIGYSLDVKNYGSQIKNADILLSGLPDGWTYSLKAGGYNINQISVLPNDNKIVTLTINVPLKVEKGRYRVKVIAKNHDVLPLVIEVSEEGTFMTEFTSDQKNMEGHSKSNFNFSTKLKNHTGEKQVYSLLARAPRGWNVSFNPNGQQATAIEIEPGKTTNIFVRIKPPSQVKSDTYKIPILATNKYSSSELELEIVIKGSYNIELTTPTGLLSSRITAGREKSMELLVRNTGSGELNNVTFNTSKPKDWQVSISPDTIPNLKVGEMKLVQATIKTANKAIPGDYISKITAQTPEISSTASIRTLVKTPLLWGWLGIFIIIGTLGVIYYLFKKYGRR